MNAALERQIRMLEQMMKQKENEINEKDAELRKSQIQIDEIEHGTEEKLYQIRSSFTMNEQKYELDTAELRRLSSQQIETIDGLREKVKKNENAMHALRSSNNMLFGENEQYRQKYSEFKQSNDEIKAKIDRLTAAKDAAIKELKKKIAENEDETEDELHMIRHSLSMNQEKYEKEIADLRALSKGQIETIDQLMNELSDLKRDKEKMMSDKDKKMKAMKAANDKLLRSLKTMQIGKKCRDKKSNKLNKVNDALKKEINALKKRVSESVSRTNHLLSSKERSRISQVSKQKMTKLRDENDALKKQIVNLEKDAKASDGKLKNTMKRMKNIQRKSGKLLKQTADNCTSCSALQNDLKDMRQEYEEKLRLQKEAVEQLRQSLIETRGYDQKENMMKDTKIQSLLHSLSTMEIEKKGEKQKLRLKHIGEDTNLTKKERIAAMRMKKKRLDEIINKLNLAKMDVNVQLYALKDNKVRKCRDKHQDSDWPTDHLAMWHIFGHKHCLDEKEQR